MKFRAVFLFFCVACGGASTTTSTPSAHTKTPEELAKEKNDKEYEALRNSEPKVPYVLDRTTAFQAAGDCGQGPFVANVDGVPGRYGERVEVYACSPREIAGRASLVADGWADEVGEGQPFGHGPPDNAKCRASDAVVAHVEESASTDASTPTSKPPTAATKTTKPTTHDEALHDDASVTLAASTCPANLRHLYLVSTDYTGEVRGKLHVHIWSADPNDLRGVLFVVQQYRVEASMTDERWKKIQSDDNVWFAKMKVFLDAHDNMFVQDTRPSYTPPPAAKTETPTPKPSANAEWVVGYWHRNGTDWTWIPGLWRVPDEDVKKDLTVAAPVAPPPLRDESSVQTNMRPPDAVWAAGNWQWDGARWVWVTGAWRVPPRQGVLWRTPTWQHGARGFVFVPGGWR